MFKIAHFFTLMLQQVCNCTSLPLSVCRSDHTSPGGERCSDGTRADRFVKYITKRLLICALPVWKSYISIIFNKVIVYHKIYLEKYIFFVFFYPGMRNSQVASIIIPAKEEKEEKKNSGTTSSRRVGMPVLLERKPSFLTYFITTIYSVCLKVTQTLCSDVRPSDELVWLGEIGASAGITGGGRGTPRIMRIRAASAG